MFMKTGLALTLLVLGHFTDDADHTLAADDLAFVADGLDGRTDFHSVDDLHGNLGNDPITGSSRSI